MSLQETKNQSSPHTIVIASKNPVKTGAVKDAFSRMFPDKLYMLQEVIVETGVSEQPFSDEETLRGALNRVKNARMLEPDADYWVGIEGGVAEHAGSLQSFAWVVVMAKNEQIGHARTAMFYQPEEVAKLVRNGMELGHADDMIFGRSNSKQHNGSVGLLTDDVIDRSSYYLQAVVLALIPFKNSHLTFHPTL